MASTSTADRDHTKIALRLGHELVELAALLEAEGGNEESAATLLVQGIDLIRMAAREKVAAETGADGEFIWDDGSGQKVGT